MAEKNNTKQLPVSHRVNPHTHTAATRVTQTNKMEAPSWMQSDDAPAIARQYIALLATLKPGEAALIDGQWITAGSAEADVLADWAKNTDSTNGLSRTLSHYLGNLSSTFTLISTLTLAPCPAIRIFSFY